LSKTNNLASGSRSFKVRSLKKNRRRISRRLDRTVQAKAVIIRLVRRRKRRKRRRIRKEREKEGTAQGIVMAVVEAEIEKRKGRTSSKSILVEVKAKVDRFSKSETMMKLPKSIHPKNQPHMSLQSNK